MKKILLLFIAMVSLIPCSSLFGQNKDHIRVAGAPELHFCPLSEGISDHYVPARKVKPYKNNAAEFVVTYSGDIPNEAVIAFEDGALGVLNGLLSSEVPIRIAVLWEQRDAGSLAAAGATSNYQGQLESPLPTRVYPVALYEKIVRQNVNGDAADINITINSSIDWHYNFQSNSTNGKSDFVSVIVHEIFHGLGFAASVAYNPDTQLGFYEAFTDAVSPDTRHSMFGDHMRSGTTRLDDIEDASASMGQVFVSGNLFFELLNSETYELYAPPVYDAGSSVSHLDQSTYENTVHSMMTPFLSAGKIERDPGISLEILYDMGWDMTRLIHSTDAGTEDFDQDKILEVEVISDSDVIEGSLMIHYSRDSFSTETVEALTLNASTGLYEGILPAPNEEAIYQYYFEASNSRNRTATAPGDAPNFLYTFLYVVDNGAPFVSHEPVNELNNEETSIYLEANITDDLFGVDTVYVEWTINGVSQQPVGMTNKLGFGGASLPDDYEVRLEFPNGSLEVGDSLTYEIFALDKSKNANVGKFPLRGADWLVIVQQVAESVVTYINDFEVVNSDFEGNGFNVLISSGFLDRGIHSAHPYPEAGANNFINFIYQLVIPITVRDENATIEFDEVVIVEPGESNTSFGDDEFWDYVVIEAQKVGTTEWVPLIPGYDSDAHPSWRSRYNAAPLTASNSLFQKREIDIKGNGEFSTDDKIFIRFRLFSDPAVNAWGWGIDNLKIQDVTSAVEDFVFQKEVLIYPNPVADIITLKLDLLKSSDEMRVTINNLIGQQVLHQSIADKSLEIREDINISHLESGIYFLNIHFNNEDVVTRKIVKQ